MSRLGKQVQLLRNNFPQLTEQLPSDGITLLAPYLTHRQMLADSELWHEGDEGNYLAFVLSGKLELLKATEFPGHPFLLGLFSSGGILGEDSFLDARPRQGTVHALEESELLILSREKLETLNSEQPELANLLLKWLMSLLSARLQNTQDRLADIF